MKENELIQTLYDLDLWWMFIGSLISADIPEEDRDKAKEIMQQLLVDIPESNLPEDVKKKSLEICAEGLKL